MGKASDKVNINLGLANDGLGVTLQALFNGMEGLIQSKTVVGEPIELGGTTLIPLLEISAGLASGALQNNAHNNGAGAMSAKVSPVAMLIIQGDRVRLVNVKNQDIFTRLLDLIPEAIDKIKGGSVSAEARANAEDVLDEMASMGDDIGSKVEVIEAEKA
ncbi:MAG: GerW family sporulation protein [Eubacteriales bacterium]|nr:GerW family sporulation protein [Eubacteriales bacterium]